MKIGSGNFWLFWNHTHIEALNLLSRLLCRSSLYFVLLSSICTKSSKSKTIRTNKKDLNKDVVTHSVVRLIVRDSVSPYTVLRSSVGQNVLKGHVIEKAVWPKIDYRSLVWSGPKMHLSKYSQFLSILLILYFKTSQESQNAAHRISHWLLRCQNVLT